MLLTVLEMLFSPTNILFMVGGVIIGIVFGAIPGLSCTTAIALLLPISFAMPPDSAIIFMGAIFVGGTSGGLVSAVLLGVPGSNANIATCFDGYPMAQNGHASKALGIGIFSSMIATLLSVAIAMVCCSPLARLAVMLGPWEFFSLCACAIVLVVTISKGNMFSGLISAGMGMAIGCIGIAPVDAAKRFTFGLANLYSGMPLLAVTLGVFAIVTLLQNFASGKMQSPDIDTGTVKGIGMSFREYFSHGKLILNSFLIGLGIGFLPGMGAGLSNVVAYAAAKSSSKTPEKFGTGCEEGVIASEIANNASVGGAIVPMIALGIPGDTTTALLISALMIQGIDAGPMLMRSNADLVWTFFGCLLVTAVITFLIEWFGTRTFPYILKVPCCYLYSAIFVICMGGMYANTRSAFSCGLTVLMAFIGVLMSYGNLPLSPFILGFILGPMMEEYLRKGMTYSTQGFLIFLQRPLSLALLAVAVAFLFWPFIRDARERKKKSSGKVTELDKISVQADSYDVSDD